MEHLSVLLRAFGIHIERGNAYGDVWKNYGALANLLSAARKIDRLMNVWWREDTTDVPMLHKDLLDDAYDAINYLTFFIRNAQAGNIFGVEPQRPAAVPFKPTAQDVDRAEHYTAPHSRACGIKKHEHGPECHSNCPTCHGRPFG